MQRPWMPTFGVLTFLIGFLACVANAPSAMALDFTCIEGSRYKVILKLFNDDVAQFSTYFNMDATYRPPPEACRAAVVTGGVEKDDADKALQFIADNQGWLATLYLASPGGSIRGGLRTALVTRMFWLKTIVVPGKTFSYVPDFRPPPLRVKADDADASAWRAFIQAAQQVPVTTVAYAGCASACTFVLAAGIDRKGIASVHRPRTDQDTSLDSVARTMERAEALMVALYRHMDAGAELEEGAHQTATQATTPKTISRFPRFIEDSLLKKCKSDVAQLDDLKRLLAWGLAEDRLLPAGLLSTPTLQVPLDKVSARSLVTEQCVAGFQERERLGKYYGLCPNGCSLGGLKALIDKQMLDLVKG